MNISNNNYVNHNYYLFTCRIQPFSSIEQPLDLPANTLFSVSMMVKLLQQTDPVIGHEMGLYIYGSK